MKKSLSAIFCLVIMLSLSVPVSASAFDSSNYASSNSSAVAQSQYEMLMDSFGFDSSLSDIVYSAILALKYYKEGSWVDIPFNSPDNTVSEVAILHQLMPGQEKVFTFDLSYYYGSISEGYYKLEIVLTQNGKNYSLSDIFFISN